MNNYDSFLSYAGEDKEIASEIAGALKARGFKIWYAPEELSVGNNLLDTIEEGLKKSKSGILLISKAYLEKNWTAYEMDVLVRKKIEKEKSIFPVWHNIKKEDIEKRHLGLSGIFALETRSGMPELISKLAKALAKFAPTIGAIPIYESPSIRFLSGRGEITLGRSKANYYENDKFIRTEECSGPATTLWEFLIYAKDSEYPLFLDGSLYGKEDLLFEAAQMLPHIPEVAINWVGKDGKEKIWKMCEDAGIDPAIFA